MSTYRQPLLAAVAVVVTTIATATAQNPSRVTLPTNEAYVAELKRTKALAITNPVAVFSFVFHSLADRVKVYPTGNYYYFRFNHNGTAYAGNIRLDTLYRDSGKVPFAYYPESAQWTEGEARRDESVGIFLDASHAVTVERLERLIYRVTYGRKRVVFAQ